jgi:hypothetical protein
LSRAEFNRAKEKLSTGELERIEKALCYAIKQMQCFSGKGAGDFKLKLINPFHLNGRRS